MNQNRKNSLLSNLDNLFDNLFSLNTTPFKCKSLFKDSTYLPSANIKETSENFQLEIFAPKIEKENLKIEIEDNLMTISTSKEIETSKEYLRQEFNYNNFNRSFILPEEGVDKEKISAELLNGVLTVTIPKKVIEKQDKKQSIEIK